LVRANLAQGVLRFFITDDNFARNRNWEAIFDRLIEMREREGLELQFIIQVDTLCHLIPNFVEKAARAGCKRDTPERIARDIRTVQQELPVDLLEFFILTPLPGSADHQGILTSSHRQARASAVGSVRGPWPGRPATGRMRR
jgi:hypothetical protein